MKDLSNENIIHVKSGDTEYLQFKKLLEYKDILAHAYGIRLDKNYRTARISRKVIKRRISISNEKLL